MIKSIITFVIIFIATLLFWFNCYSSKNDLKTLITEVKLKREAQLCFFNSFKPLTDSSVIRNIHLKMVYYLDSLKISSQIISKFPSENDSLFAIKTYPIKIDTSLYDNHNLYDTSIPDHVLGDNNLFIFFFYKSLNIKNYYSVTITSYGH